MAVATGSLNFSSPRTYSNHVPLHSSHLANGNSHPSSPLRLQNGQPSTPHKEPFMRVDTLGMKTRLVDVLKGDADVYLKHLGLFLVGKLRRDEWEGLMGKVLDTEMKRQLHNQLLTALLHNASCTTPISTTPTLPLHPTSSLTLDPAFASSDPDALIVAQERLQAEDTVKPRRRVRKWVLGMKRDERERVKAVGRASMEDDRAESSSAITEMNRGWQGSARKRKLLQTFEPTSVPYCQTTGVLPSPDELQVRLQAMATEQGLPKGCADDLGEFVSAALETHLDGLFYAAWQMIQANSVEDADVDDAVPPPKTATALPTQAVSMEAMTSSDTTGSNISDDVPAQEVGNLDTVDGDVEMQDADVATPSPIAIQPAPTAGPTPTNPFPHRTLTLQDFQNLILSSPNLLPHASASLYKLQTNVYAALEAEEQLAERLSKQRDERYHIKQAQVVAHYQKEFEMQSKIQAQELMREREIKMMNAAAMAARRKSRAHALSLSAAMGMNKKPKVESSGSQAESPLTAGSKSSATPPLTLSAMSEKFNSVEGGRADKADSNAMDVDSKVEVAEDKSPEAAEAKGTTQPQPIEKTRSAPSKPRLPPTPLGTPGVGGIILRPSAKAKLAQLGYTGPLGGNGVGLIPVAANITMAGELQAMAMTGSRPINPAVEQLKQEMLFHEVLKPVPLPAAADVGRDGGPAQTAGLAMGLTGEALADHIRSEREREEGERQRTAVMSAMSGLPVNSGNHWAYVDPALLLKDILG